jgi:hypothetical protein
MNGVWKECAICGKKYLVASIVLKMDYDDEFCPDAIKHFAIRRKEKTDKLPQETKQKVLDIFRKGKTIGEIMEKLGLGLDEVSGIIEDNITKVYMLNEKAV